MISIATTAIRTIASLMLVILCITLIQANGLIASSPFDFMLIEDIEKQYLFDYIWYVFFTLNIIIIAIIILPQGLMSVSALFTGAIRTIIVSVILIMMVYEFIYGMGTMKGVGIDALFYRAYHGYRLSIYGLTAILLNKAFKKKDNG